MAKVTVLTCWPLTDIQNCPRWPLCPTYGQEVKGQTKVKFQTSSNGKSSSINVLALDKHQKILTVTSLSNLWLKGQGSNFTKCKLNMRLCSDLFTDLVSSSSCSCSSSSFFFCQHFSDLYLGHDLTDFDQTWSQVPVDHSIYVTWPDWGQRARRGHRGQKVVFTKNATPPTD